jgi:hypothetical protein
MKRFQLKLRAYYTVQVEGSDFADAYEKATELLRVDSENYQDSLEVMDSEEMEAEYERA